MLFTSFCHVNAMWAAWLGGGQHCHLAARGLISRAFLFILGTLATSAQKYAWIRLTSDSKLAVSGVVALQQTIPSNSELDKWKKTDGWERADSGSFSETGYP